MERQGWRDTPREPGQPDILHEHRIDARAVEKPQIISGFLKFPSENQRIEGDVSLDPVPMAEGDELWEFLLGEVVRPHAGVEPGQAEVDRVRAVGDGRAYAIPVTCRGEKFRCRDHEFLNLARSLYTRERF